MVLRFVVLFVTAFFVGCSVSTPPNQWQYKSTNSFNSFKKNFLEGNDLLAEVELKRAISKASSSADLKQLARVYLGACALHKAVGLEDDCKEYKKIQNLLEDKKLDNYYFFINKEFDKVDKRALEERYRPFVEALQEKKIQNAVDIALKEKDPLKKLMMISLLGDKASLTLIDDGIKLLSYYGYKKGVITLLKMKLKGLSDEQQKRNIQKKIEILENVSL